MAISLGRLPHFQTYLFVVPPKQFSMGRIRPCLRSLPAQNMSESHSCGYQQRDAESCSTDPGFFSHLNLSLSENRVSTPLYPMVLLIIIPMKNGYFIGNIPYFQTNPPIFGMAKVTWQSYLILDTGHLTVFAIFIIFHHAASSTFNLGPIPICLCHQIGLKLKSRVYMS